VEGHVACGGSEAAARGGEEAWARDGVGEVVLSQDLDREVTTGTKPSQDLDREVDDRGGSGGDDRG
jgi:hypothetical protein